MRAPDRATLAYALPLAGFLAFGAARVVAPVGVIGLLFDEPLGFVLAAVVTLAAGVLLMHVPGFELAVGRVLAGPSRPPGREEHARLDPVLARLGERSGVDVSRLVVRIQDSPALNASAGAAHLLFVTRGALRLAPPALEAVLAHELGHHRGLHPILAAAVWWLSLPGVALAAVFAFLRRLATALGARFGTPGLVLALPVRALLLVWQVAVMWLFYVAQALSAAAGRAAEFRADAAAADWGYGTVLLRLYGAIADAGGSAASANGRLSGMRRLMSDHPPLDARIAALERTGR